MHTRLVVLPYTLGLSPTTNIINKDKSLVATPLINASGHWCTPFQFDPEDYFGFIYLITNNINNKRYVGKKQFKSYFKRPPLKGRKNKRHCSKDSNWRCYTSSSQYVLDDIAACGVCNFTFTIIHLCANKSQMAYYEPFYMYKYNVLTERDKFGNRTFYNMRIPGCKSIPKL